MSFEKLREQRFDVERRLHDIALEMKNLENTKIQLKTRLKNINNEINAASKRKITVTDHAIARYFERVVGLSRESLELSVLPEEYRHVIKEDGDYEIKSKIGNFVIRVKSGNVITILD